MDCSPPGSSVHGISQEEYGSGLPFSSLADLPDPGIRTCISGICRLILYHWAIGEVQCFTRLHKLPNSLKRWGMVIFILQMRKSGAKCLSHCRRVRQWWTGLTLVSSAPRAFGPKPTWRRQGLLDFWPVTPELCSVHCPLSLLAAAVCVQLSGVFTAVPSGVSTLAVSPIQRCLTNGSELNTLKGSSGHVMRWLRNLNSSPSTEERTSHPGILSSGEELALQQAEDRVLAFCNMERWLLSAPWAVVVRAGPFSQNSH